VSCCRLRISGPIRRCSISQRRLSGSQRPPAWRIEVARAAHRDHGAERTELCRAGSEPRPRHLREGGWIATSGRRKRGATPLACRPEPRQQAPRPPLILGPPGRLGGVDDLLARGELHLQRLDALAQRGGSGTLGLPPRLRPVPRRGCANCCGRGCKGSRCFAKVHLWMQFSFLLATTVQTVPARHFRGTSTDGPWSLRGRMTVLTRPHGSVKGKGVRGVLIGQCRGLAGHLPTRIGADRRQFANRSGADGAPCPPGVARLCESAAWRRIARG
jgi:hypothetical protein